MCGDVAAEFDQFAEYGGRHLAVGHVDRRLHHGQDEALPAEPVEMEVAFLGLEQALAQIPGIHVVRQQIGEALLGQPKRPLGVPERVVRIEADGGQFAHGRGK
jgi:hypothetical protein